MKRGLIEWDRQELPASTIEKRQARCRSLLAKSGLDGLLLYTDVWRSGQARYLTNFIPYWNQGMLLFPASGEPILIAALSARVYPWIKGTSTLENVVSGASLGADAAAQIKNFGWKRVGAGELESLPQGILNPLVSNLGECELTDATALLDSLRDRVDPGDLSLYRNARQIAEKGFEEIASSFPGKSSWQVASLLERALRRRGVTDTVILLAPGGDSRWPAYPSDDTMTASGFVVLSVEYKGHWVEMGRPASTIEPSLRETFARLTTALHQNRSEEAVQRDVEREVPLSNTTLMISATHRSFPFTPIASLAGIPNGTVLSLHLSGLDRNGVRRWWGETLVKEGDGVVPLLSGG